ncbi:6-carboxytetrahydropterin synthase [Filimonas effusa]|nr:6-carboxytetrahydropterin synthase [Filimonas effusa]
MRLNSGYLEPGSTFNRFVMGIQLIERKGSFDAGHRIMNEKTKCFSIHGHTYLYDLIFEFGAMEQIGYAIDFKEIKRVGVQWIEDTLDHGVILNPKDVELIKAADATKSRRWLMSLNGEGEYCNPSVENVAKELFLAIDALFLEYQDLRLHSIKLHETPNCATTCFRSSISNEERDNWSRFRLEQLKSYAAEKGIMNYDDRK